MKHISYCTYSQLISPALEICGEYNLDKFAFQSRQVQEKRRFHLNKRTPDGLQAAIKCFEQAERLHPDSALVHRAVLGPNAVKQLST